MQSTNHMQRCFDSIVNALHEAQTTLLKPLTLESIDLKYAHFHLYPFKMRIFFIR